MYKLPNNGFDGILLGDTWVPNNEQNADWQRYQAWLADGNEPMQPDELPVVKPTVDDAKRLNTLIHFVASLPNAPQDVKDLNGDKNG